MGEFNFPADMPEAQRERLWRDHEHMLLRREAVGRLCQSKALMLAKFDPSELVIARLVMGEIVRAGYCPTFLDWLAQQARITPGYASRALTSMVKAGMVEEFREEEPYVQLANGPWLPPGVPVGALNRTPFDEPTRWNG